MLSFNGIPCWDKNLDSLRYRDSLSSSLTGSALPSPPAALTLLGFTLFLQNICVCCFLGKLPRPAPPILGNSCPSFRSRIKCHFLREVFFDSTVALIALVFSPSRYLSHFITLQSCLYKSEQIGSSMRMKVSVRHSEEKQMQLSMPGKRMQPYKVRFLPEGSKVFNIAKHVEMFLETVFSLPPNISQPIKLSLFLSREIS